MVQVSAVIAKLSKIAKVTIMISKLVLQVVTRQTDHYSDWRILMS
jgi:hypothetical protein